jgi:prepilin-type N-terminal cleavage/methylation domain-containing protein
VSRSRQSRHETGFTLIEIVIAIMILSVSLVVLIGLQSASIERAVRDRATQQAMLLARSILAGIESSPDPIPVGAFDTPALQMVQQYRAAPEGADFPPELDRFSASLIVEPVAVPIIKDGVPAVIPNALKKILLTIYWGTDPTEQFPVLFFIPNDEGGLTDDVAPPQ